MKILPFFLMLAVAGAVQTDQTIARVAEVEAKLPWFWSPPMEGFYEIPYTFESEGIHRVLDNHGKDKKGPLKLHLERTAVLGGIVNRCVSENGVSPCSATMLATYERGNQKVLFGPQERAVLREHRQQFWAEFPKAFRFETISADRYRFVPSRDYRPGAGAHSRLLANIRGEIVIDPQTAELRAMSYEVLTDVDISGRGLTKGTKYSITLTNAPGGHYLPLRLYFEQPIGKDSVVQAEDYSNYKRFAVDVDVQFGDVPDAR